MPDRFVIEDFRNIFEAASIGIALVDNKGRPFLANPRLCSLLGYSSTELATMSFTEFTHPEDVEIDWDLYSQLIAGERESYQIHKRYFHKDGSLIHALLNVSVLHDENQSVRFAIGMVQDISREVESTEALEHSLRHNAQQAARFKLLYQIASRSDLSFHAQVEEGLKSVARLLDMDVGIISHIEGDTYTAEHVYSTGSSIAQGSQFPLGDTYSSIALGQSDVVAIERMSQSKWSSRPCYTLFRFESYIGCRFTVAQQVYGTIAFASTYPHPFSFTEFDCDFLRLFATWIGYRYERYQSYQHVKLLNSRLENSNRQLEQFAYAASHDLREPLRTVAGFSSLLETRFSSQLDNDPTAAEHMSFIRDAVGRMENLIDSLLELSRISSSEIAMDPVSLQVPIDDAIANLATAINETGAEIQLPPLLPTLRANRIQLTHLFQNLFSNAIKFRKDSVDPVIRVEIEFDGDECLIRVVDNGTGIAKDHCERIFAPFKRLVGQHIPGTGIGLALCRSIVARHGGTISASGTIGEGATFTIQLPLTLVGQ